MCAYAHYHAVMGSSRRIDHCNCFASRKAARLITRIYEEHLAPVGLSSSQFALLAHLDEVGTASMKELVEAMAMERSSVVRALQPLERDGLVVQTPDLEDARRNVIAASAAGRRQLALAVPLWRDAQAEFERKFGAGFARQMRESVRSMEI